MILGTCCIQKPCDEFTHSQASMSLNSCKACGREMFLLNNLGLMSLFLLNFSIYLHDSTGYNFSFYGWSEPAKFVQIMVVLLHFGKSVENSISFPSLS